MPGRLAKGTGAESEPSGATENDLSRSARDSFRINLLPSALTGTKDDAIVIGRGVARVLELCGPLAVTNCPPHAKVEPEGGASAPADITALAALETRPVVKRDEARIELLAANVHGAPNVASLHAVKAEAQGVKELDDMFVGMHLAQAQRLLYGTEKPQANAVVLQLVHTSQIPAAKARLAELLGTTLKGEPLEVQDFEVLNPFYGQALAMFGAIFGFISVLIGAIVLFTVGNTMSMAVMERTTEIGTLRAMGLRRSGIRKLFVCEGLLLGLFGAAIGMLISLLIAFAINHSNLTWLPPGQVDPVPLTVRVWGENGLIFGTTVGLALIAVVSAWWPARRAARMLIVDALRHV